MYKIVGADGRLYGPVSAEQIRQWIAEGRANAQTQVLPDGAAAWKPLGTLPEFSMHFAAQIPPTIPPLAGGPARKNHAFAVAGLIFGLLSLLCCFKILTGVLGIVFSLVALSQINREPERYDGREMAIAGIILSILGILISLALIAFWLATGSFQFHHSWNFNRFGQ